MSQGRENSFLPALPDGYLCCCEKPKLASLQTTGATAISVPKGTSLSLSVQVAEGEMPRVSILLLNLEEETNPRS